MLACFIPIYSSRWQVCDLIEQFHRIFFCNGQWTKITEPARRAR